MADPEAPAEVPGHLQAWKQALLVLGFGATLAFGVAGVASLGAVDVFTRLDFLAAIAAALSLVVSGAILISRLPSHPVGWLLWGGGCLFALAGGGTGIAGLLLAGDPGLAAWVVVLCGACWVPAIVTVAVLLPLVFPTGRLPSARWRGVVAVGVVSALFSAIQDLFSPFAPGLVVAGIANPLATTGAAAAFVNALGAASSVAGVVCLPLVAASLLIRFRRASGVERAQLKWLAAAVAIVGPALAVAIVFQAIPGDAALFLGNVAYLAMFVGLTLLPVAIGIAVLRYQLYQIDLIIRRTVVYVPLTAILAGLYAGSIALFQRVFIAVTGGPSDGAVIASTLILATLFTPIKNALQTIVDRRFREELDADRRLEAYVDRIETAEWTPDPPRTLRGFLVVAVRAFDATGGRALVVEGDRWRPVATVGGPTVPHAIVEVESGGDRIGRIELGPRNRGRPYRSSETTLLAQAARRLAEAIARETWDEPGPSPTARPTEAPAPGADLVEERGRT